MAMHELAQVTARRRGPTGLRAAAKEIGISPATLSRIENGHVPDLKTLEKVCLWLEMDPSRFVGEDSDSIDAQGVALQIAFKKDPAVSPQTARSLAVLIQAANDQFLKEIESEGH